jgi:hypothetical protein
MLLATADVAIQKAAHVAFGSIAVASATSERRLMLMASPRRRQEHGFSWSIRRAMRHLNWGLRRGQLKNGTYRRGEVTLQSWVVDRSLRRPVGIKPGRNYSSRAAMPSVSSRLPGYAQNVRHIFQIAWQRFLDAIAEPRLCRPQTRRSLVTALGVRRGKASLSPVGVSPTRQPLRPEATGAVMEVTKWLKPSVSAANTQDARAFRDAPTDVAGPPLWVIFCRRA